VEVWYAFHRKKINSNRERGEEGASVSTSWAPWRTFLRRRLNFTVPVTHVIIFLGNSWRAAELTPCRPQAALKLDDLVRRTSTYHTKNAHIMLDNIFSINNIILSSLANSTTIRLTSPLSYFSSYVHFKIFIRPVVAVNSHIFHCSPFTQETGTTS
jgi:hypothetical protein